MTATRLSIVTLIVALILAAGLFAVGDLLPTEMGLPLVVAVPLFALVSCAAAIKARAHGLTIASAFVTFALIPLLYVLTLILFGP